MRVAITRDTLPVPRYPKVEHVMQPFSGIHQATANPDLMSKRQLTESCHQTTSPMADAATLSDPSALDNLLSHGARLNPLAIFHAIGIRAQRNGTSMLKVLVEHGADVTYVSKRWGTLLCYAVRMRRDDQLEVLMDAGADAEIESLNTKDSALENAKEVGQMKYYELMQVKNGEGEMVVGRTGVFVLEMAARLK
jgi:ankyrin repeat protein